MIGLPTTNQNFAGGASTITWGTSPNVPASITNPASLKPWTQPVNPAVWSSTVWLSTPAGYNWNQPVTPLAKPAIPTTLKTSAPLNAPTSAPINDPNAGKAVDMKTGEFVPWTWTVAPTNWQLTDTQNQQVNQWLQPNILSDKTNYAQMWISEADFNNLPPDVRLKMLEEKKAQIWLTQDTLKQLEAAQIIERQKQYSQTQEANRLEQEAINANIAWVQASQRLKDASKNVENLKQNAWFLWSWGRPVKSQASIDAMWNSINEAQTTFQIMKNTEDQFAKLRGLQSEWQAKTFEENMARLDDQLKQQTTSLFLKAYLDYKKEADWGKLDTPKKILEFQQRMLATVDDSLEGITQNQLSQVNALIEAGKTYAEQMKAETEREQKLEDEKRQNARKTDMERSKAMWVLLDWNGDPILTPAWQEIPVPKDLPPGVTAIRDEVWGFVRIPKMNPDWSIGYDKVKAWTPSPTAQLETWTMQPWSVNTIDRNQAISQYGSSAAVRNFNPWNIMDTGFGWQKVPWERFTRFDTPAQWFNALVSKIQNIQNWGSIVYSPNMTITQYISKYAPASDNNNVSAYANFIANKLWVSVNTTIWQLDPVKLASAHAQHEDWNSYRMLLDLGIINKDWTAWTPKSTDQWPVWGSGAPIAYERRIKNMVPATLMNSEIELKQLNDTIKALSDAGVSPEDAVLTYLGVSVDKPEDKDFAWKLITVAKWLDNPTPSFYSNISDFINKGDKLGAVMKLEREAVAQAQKNNPDLKFSDAWSSFIVKQAKNIQDLMTSYENQFWPVKGTWNDATKWIFWNKEAQTLATKITQAISKARNDLVGSNITQWEKDAIKDLIPALSETADTAKIKVQNLIDTPLLQYNEARKSVWLPELDIDTLINRDKRINLYWWQQMQSTSTQWSLSGWVNRLKKN